MKKDEFDFKTAANHIIAKVLFVFGWILDQCFKLLNAVNKTPIENDMKRKDIRTKQFAVSFLIFYLLCNSAVNFVCKTLSKLTAKSYISSHFMPWDIFIPRSIAVLITELMLSLAVGLGITVKLHTLYRMKNDTKNIKGDSKFMSNDEIMTDGNFYAVKKTDISSAERSGALICEDDNYYYIEPDTFNIAIVGATRSGKGELYILNSLRLMANAKDKPSVIVNDIKGEIVEQLYQTFIDNGYKVVVLDLIDTELSMCWNVLELIKKEYLHAQATNKDFSQTSKLVSSFAHCLTDDDRSEAVWTASAHSLLSALIFYFLDKGYELNDMENVNMYSITTFFAEFGTYYTAVGETEEDTRFVNALDEIFQQLPEGSLAKLAYTTSNFSKGDTRSSIFTVLSSCLNIFMTDTGIQKMTSRNEIDFDDLIDPCRPCAVFMCVPFEDKTRHVITSMFVDQSFGYLIRQARYMPGGRLKRRVEYMLDEFGQMPKIPDMSSKANVSAGCNILFNLYLQDYSQLEKYRKDGEGEGIKSSCGIQIYITSLNNKTNKDFSETIGSETISYMTFSGNLHGFLNSQRETVDRKSLMDINQLSRLPFGTTIVKKMRCNPIMTKITPYHTLADKPPRVLRRELPYKHEEISLPQVLFDLNIIWDNLGLIGEQYRLDKLKEQSEKRLNTYYDLLQRLQNMQTENEPITEEFYAQVRDAQQQAEKAELEVINYTDRVNAIKDFRSEQREKIFINARNQNSRTQAYPQTQETIPDYEPYEEADDAQTSLTEVLDKLRKFDCNEFFELMQMERYKDARNYLVRIKPLPQIRNNLSSYEFSLLESYIDREEKSYDKKHR